MGGYFHSDGVVVGKDGSAVLTNVQVKFEIYSYKHFSIVTRDNSVPKVDPRRKLNRCHCHSLQLDMPEVLVGLV